MGTRSVSVLIALVLAACASSPPPATPPPWTSLPALVVESFCAKLHAEAIAADAPVAIVKTTRPIITGAALRSLAHNYSKDGEAGPLAQALTASLPPMPVDFADSKSCNWLPLDRIDPVANSQEVVVEFSAPFVNPFTRGESGLFARMTVGGHDAQWYWIPLAERNGRWAIGIVLPMDLHEG